MFLRAEDLKLSYGVSLDIGRFYVNRTVSVDNAYWKNRHLYIPPVPGFMFMPIMSDLARRVGINTTEQLSEKYISVAEFILDSAARNEMKDIDCKGHVEECLQYAKDRCINQPFYDALAEYLRSGVSTSSQSKGLGTSFPSLNRADTYLISYCTLSFDESVGSDLLKAWYALMTYFLLQDDLSDIREDLRNQEQNALIEAGLTDTGAYIIKNMVLESWKSMEQINPVLANRIECLDQTMDIEGLVRKIRQEISNKS